MATLKNIDKVLQAKMIKAIDGLMPVLLNEAVNWTKQNFRRQGWPGQGFQAWPARKANARRNAGRGILINTGRLSRSPRIISNGKLQGSFGTDVPYAKAHNDGVNQVVTVKSHRRAKLGTITRGMSRQRGITGFAQVKSHQRHMRLPQRKFIGASPVLTSILTKKAVVHIGRILKS